jgi:hypothetical protein
MEATGSCAAAGAKRGRQSRPASTRRGVSGAAGGGASSHPPGPQPSPRRGRKRRNKIPDRKGVGRTRKPRSGDGTAAVATAVQPRA